MTNIRRYFQRGSVYFLTHVTFNRDPLLVKNIDLLRHAMDSTKKERPYDLIAWVVLPDHMHLLIDPADNDLSSLMRKVKLSFSTSLRRRLELKSGRVWQYRFWDHIIRDESDLNLHVDYIHHNPVRHGLTGRPCDWPHSSFDEYSGRGYYSRDWGIRQEPQFEGEFGE